MLGPIIETPLDLLVLEIAKLASHLGLDRATKVIYEAHMAVSLDVVQKAKRAFPADPAYRN